MNATVKAYTERTYVAAGTATGPDGQVKVRWCSDLITRLKRMVKQGASDINLIYLPRPMTKVEGLEYLKTLDLKPAELQAIEDKLAEIQEKLNPVPKKRGRKPKQAPTITIDSIRSRKSVSVEKSSLAEEPA